ncbi:MAG: hypothetical protein FWC70_09210 [Defluviitaleaceae bacterium]|nr:hypothetical protein [Defluviitaleaceae bacterium]
MTPTEKKHSPHWQIIVAAAISILAALSVPTLFLPFILIPAAFAFPLIIDRPKLLFIPSGVALATIAVLALVLQSFNLDILVFFFILAAIPAAFGMAAGWLIRFFRTRSTKVKILSIAVGGIILLVPFLFVAEIFTGIFRMPMVALRVNAYVARHYADFDLAVGRPSYSFKNGDFSVQVRDSNNPDVSFLIRYHNGEINDGFTQGNFWAATINNMLAPLLEQEFGDELRSFTSSVSGVQAGQKFDLNADVEKTARISVNAESLCADVLAAKITRYHEFISQNGINFDVYVVTFRYCNNERPTQISVPREFINNDLPALIEYAQNNRNEHGTFFDRETRFRYGRG